MNELAFTLPVAAPFRLDLTVWVLRRREKNTVDRWDGQSYTRVLTLRGSPVKLTAAQTGTPSSPQLAVRLQSQERLPAEVQAEAQTTLQKVLGLAAVVSPFYAVASHDPALERLAKQFIGVRPPRFPTVFEALVNAIACQQVSLDVGILLLNRLAERCGAVFSDEHGTVYAFPRPEDVLGVPEDELKQLGFSHQKVQTIKTLALRVAKGDVAIEQLELANNDEAIACLEAIRGIGRWSAEYTLLRGLGRLDIFPGDDVGGQNNVQQLLGLAARPGYDQLKEITAAWYPYAGFVYFHLLLAKLHAKGLI